MRQDDGFRLEDGFAAEDSTQFLQSWSDCALEATHDRFYNTLLESTEHPLREALPVHVQRLLTHLETLPMPTADYLAAKDTTFFRNWLLYHHFFSE
jgi:hypothetical protein